MGSEYLPLLVMERANTGTGTWQVPILEMNAIAAMPILVWALASAHTENERHRGSANMVLAPIDAQYWN